MRGALSVLLSLLPMSAVAASAADFVSREQVEGRMVWAGATGDGRTECRAPFGEDIVFAVEAGRRLYLVNRTTGARVELTTAEIQRFRAELAAGLERVRTTREALLASPEISAELKRQLMEHGEPPDPRLDTKPLRALSTPAANATDEPAFRELNESLDRLRGELESAGLAHNTMHAFLVCAYDLSRVPVIVSGRAPGTRIEIVRRAAVSSKAARSPPRSMSLTELMWSAGSDTDPSKEKP